MSSLRTATAIITSVLNRIGNNTSAMVTEAEAQLNILISGLYDNRWPFLRGTVNRQALPLGVTAVSLPADYGDLWLRDSFWIYDSNGNQVPLLIMTQPEFDITSLATSSGTPMRVFIDPANKVFYVIPGANASYTYTVIYQRDFTYITDFAQLLEFPYDDLVEQGLFVWACQHEDDDRYVTEMQVFDKMLANYKKKWNRSVLKGRSSLSSWAFRSNKLWR